MNVFLEFTNDDETVVQVNCSDCGPSPEEFQVPAEDERAHAAVFDHLARVHKVQV